MVLLNIAICSFPSEGLLGSLCLPILRIKHNVLTVAYQLYIISPSVCSTSSSTTLPTPVHPISDNGPLLLLERAKYTLILGPLYLFFPGPEMLFSQEFI